MASYHVSQLYIVYSKNYSFSLDFCIKNICHISYFIYYFAQYYFFNLVKLTHYYVYLTSCYTFISVWMFT